MIEKMMDVYMQTTSNLELKAHVYKSHPNVSNQKLTNKEFSWILQTCVNLTSLTVDNVQFMNPSRWISLFETLKEANSLSYLQICGCPMTEAGDKNELKILCASIKRLKLTHLVLCNNKITSMNVRFLTEEIALNNTIRLLDLSNNPLGDTGFASVVESLLLNVTVQRLVMWKTTLSNKIMPSLQLLISLSNSITEISLGDNPLLTCVPTVVSQIKHKDPAPLRFIMVPCAWSKNQISQYLSDNKCDEDILSTSFNSLMKGGNISFLFL